MKTVCEKGSVIVISDTHIGALPLDTERLVKHIDRFDLVILAGDIFDLWGTDISSFTEDPLYKWIVANRNRCLYIVGNHDCAIWESNVPFDLHSGIILKSGDKSFTITHGHIFDHVHKFGIPPKTSKILHKIEVFLNRLFRTVWQRVIFVERKMFTRIGDWIRDKRLVPQRLRARYYRMAIQTDYLIHGHTHKQETYADGKIYDVGSLSVTGTYALIRDGNIRIYKWH